MSEQVITVAQFKGLNDYAVPERDPSVTRDLNAVYTRNGRIIGAPGMVKYGNVSTAASAAITKLMPFYTTSLQPTLYRMLPTKVEQYSPITHSWSDVTGTALNGFDYSRPQFVVHKDTLVFTNEAADRPRKLIGSGNSAQLGGTPPYCRAIWQAWGFLFLGAVSDDGTTFFERRVIYSDDFDVDWTLCSGNELNFNETNGGILAGSVVNAEGDVVIVCKSDAIMQLRFVGGPVRFSQDKLKFGNGIIAPASLKPLDGIGAVLLATDMRLQFCNGFKVDTVPPYVQKKLDDTLDPIEAPWAFGETFPDRDTYSLWYQAKTGLTNRILMNFRTGEFNHREYANHVITAATVTRESGRNKLLLSTASLVYEESDSYATDDGNSINRYYTIDWSSLGQPGEKEVVGVEFNALKKTGGRVAVAVAADDRENYYFEKVFALRNLASDGTNVKIIYRVDPGVLGREHKIRIRLIHDDDGSAVELLPPMKIFFNPINEPDGLATNLARASSVKG